MIGGFRESMTWLHTWAGLVFCWILYFVFVTGTLGYVDSEIDRWMKPERGFAEPVPLETTVGVATSYLQREAQGADLWVIRPADGRGQQHPSVFIEMPEPEEHEEAVAEEGEEAAQEGHEENAEGAEGAQEDAKENVEDAAAENTEEPERRRSESLDVATGAPLPELERETGGGQALYRMHYTLHYLDRNVAFRFVGFLAMCMLLAIVSGIVIHKQIFKELFTFRPGKGLRSWLDAHNLLSVSSLPFQLMITYSGLLFTFGVWMPMIGLASYGFDSDAFGHAGEEAFGEVSVERSGEAAALADLSPMAQYAEAEWGPGGMGSLTVHVPGDANARVVASRRGQISALNDSLVFDGTTGELIESRVGHPNAPLGFAGTMLGLHEGLFAGPFLRWLYVLSGLLGCAMVATGAIYWTAKRKRRMRNAPTLGYRFVDALNVGTILGLPIGIAAYFWANRLLPAGMEHRPEWEMHCLFIVWGICLLFPVFRPREAAWREQAWVGAFAFGALPILNAFTTDAHLANSIPRGDWVLAGFDLATIAVALGFATVALVLRRPARSRQRATVALAAGEEANAP